MLMLKLKLKLMLKLMLKLKLILMLLGKLTTQVGDMVNALEAVWRYVVITDSRQDELHQVPQLALGRELDPVRPAGHGGRHHRRQGGGE